MSGNVWEWCSDWYGSYSSSLATNPTGAQTGSCRVARGGSWFYDVPAYGCRSAYRSNIYPNGRFNEIGFRVVRRSSVTPLKYTLSGTITGADNITVTLSGGLSGVQTVNSGGRYSFTVESGGDYTVTPSKSVGGTLSNFAML